MFIQKKRVRDVAQYIEDVPDGGAFYVAVEIAGSGGSALSQIGFDPSPAKGDTVLPSIVGPVSRFNAEGAWETHRDQLKEDRYIRTVLWRWRQWAGRNQFEDKEDFRDIYRAYYPRTFIEPPAIELTVHETNGIKRIVGPTLVKGKERDDRVRHVINLFLEAFGECEIVADDLSRLSKVKVRRVNWRMLPPGQYPWETVKAHFSKAIARQSRDVQRVILDRQYTIMSLKPDEQHIGLGGFSDYIAYVFKNKGIVVLESIRRDNAIYVFGDGWKRFSRLTKAEVLRNGHHIARIIHTRGWKAKLAMLLDKRTAA